MKRNNLSLVFLLLAGLFFSCSKDKKTEAFSYSVNNVQDQNITANGTTTMSFATTLLTGTTEQVTLTVNGLPSGVTATPSTKTGTPNFTSDFVLKATNATVGTYPMTLEATSASTEKKVYNFNLTVAANPAPTDCSGNLVATYTGSEACNIGNDNYSITITTSGTANKVIISNMYNEGFNVYANIDCDSKTLVIPSQTLTSDNGNVTISGSGTYTTTGIKITYTITSTSTTNSCTMTFARQ